MARTEIKINDFGGRATLRVTVTKTKRFAFRLWLAVRLITLACQISHMNIDYSELGEGYGESTNDN